MIAATINFLFMRPIDPIFCSPKNASSRPAALARLVTVLVWVVVAVPPFVRAGLVLENGFELGQPDWEAAGVWKPQPSDATSTTLAPREGKRSVRFLPNADLRAVRSEFVFRAPFSDPAVAHGVSAWDGRFNWGTEYWEGFSIRVTRPLNGFGIVFQHHAVPAMVSGRVDWNVSAGENSFTIKTRDNNFIIYTATVAGNVAGADIVEATGVTRRRAQTGAATWGTAATEPIPFEPGRWYDFVLHFRLAPDDTGIMQVWTRDGAAPGAPWTKRVDVTAGVTVYKYDSGKTASSGKAPVGDHRDGLPKCPASTQKIGLYYGNNASASITGEICYDSFRVWEGPGGRLEAVAPPAAAVVTRSAGESPLAADEAKSAPRS